MELMTLLGIASLLIFGCLLSSKISGWLNMPCLLLFLAVGLIAGSEGLGRIAFDNATQANYLGSVAMAFILFSGGFDTSWKSVKSVLTTGGILASIGVLLTALFVGLASWGFIRLIQPTMPVSLAWCLLLGSIISSTDAAAVFSILRSRSVSLRGRIQPLLEFESGSNDPMAAFLTLFMVGVVATEHITGTSIPITDYLWIIPSFLQKMLIGIASGWSIGKLAVWIYNRINFEYDGLYYVLAVVLVLFSFSITELISGNGFMAVYVAGMMLGNTRFVFHNGIGKFYEGVAWLMQVVLFTMLGLLAFPKQLFTVWLLGLFVAIFLMFAARPLAVFLSMAFSPFNTRERLFVSWVGLRGGAPIMLATFPLMAAIPEANILFHVVFFVVLISVILQGMTIMPLARCLHLDSPLHATPRNPVIIEHTGTMDATSREITIAPNTVDGHTLAHVTLPPSVLVMVIRRGDTFIIPRGSTILHTGDTLTIMGSDKALEQTELLLKNEQD